MMTIFLALLCAAFAWVLWRIAFWYNEGRKMQETGYLPPPPSWFGRMGYRLLGRLCLFLYIGPVKVIGKENARYDGRLFVLPNHQHGFDTFPIVTNVPFSFRQIGALKEVKGFMSGPAAFLGTFTVPVMGGKAQKGAHAAIEACAKVLCLSPHSKLLMFPQGKLVVDNVLRSEDFRTGAVRIMQLVASRVGGDNLAFLPIAERYKDSPEGASIGRKFLHWVGTWAGARFMSRPRYGVTIVIGKPVPYSTLPEDPRQATEVIRQHIQRLLDIADAS